MQRYRNGGVGLIPTHVEDGDTNHVPVLVDLLHDGVVVGLSKVALFPFKEHLKIIGPASTDVMRVVGRLDDEMNQIYFCRRWRSTYSVAARVGI